jgi:hypothetical protein
MQRFEAAQSSVNPDYKCYNALYGGAIGQGCSLVNAGCCVESILPALLCVIKAAKVSASFYFTHVLPQCLLCTQRIHIRSLAMSANT